MLRSVSSHENESGQREAVGKRSILGKAMGNNLLEVYFPPSTMISVLRSARSND